MRIFFFLFNGVTKENKFKISDHLHRYVDLRSLSGTRRLLPGGVQPLQSGGETAGI